MSRWGCAATPRPALYRASAGVPAQRAGDGHEGRLSLGLPPGPAGGATPRRGRPGCRAGAAVPAAVSAPGPGAEHVTGRPPPAPWTPGPTAALTPAPPARAGWGGGAHFPAASEGAAGRRAERASYPHPRLPRRSRRTRSLRSPRGPVSLPPASLSAMVAQPRPARRASGAAPVPEQVPVRVLGGALAGSEPPGSGSTALTRPPPQPGLLPVLLPGPPRAPRPAPRRGAAAGKGRRGGGPGQGAPRLPARRSEARPLLSGSPLSRPRRGWWRGRFSAAHQPVGLRRAQGARLGERRGLDFRPLRPLCAPCLWNGRGPKPCSKQRTQTYSPGEVRSPPRQFISLPQGPRRAIKGPREGRTRCGQDSSRRARTCAGPCSGHRRGRQPPGSLRDSMATRDPGRRLPRRLRRAFHIWDLARGPR